MFIKSDMLSWYCAFVMRRFKIFHAVSEYNFWEDPLDCLVQCKKLYFNQKKISPYKSRFYLNMSEFDWIMQMQMKGCIPLSIGIRLLDILLYHFLFKKKLKRFGILINWWNKKIDKTTDKMWLIWTSQNNYFKCTPIGSNYLPIFSKFIMLMYIEETLFFCKTENNVF